MNARAYRYSLVKHERLRSSRYKTAPNAAPQDALAILSAAGLNAIRLRVWVNPSRAQSYCNVSSVAAMAKRVAANNMRVWIDFHYADSWADPQKQPKPQQWAALDAAGLKASLVAHTTAMIGALVAQGTPPYVVSSAVAAHAARPDRAACGTGQLCAPTLSSFACVQELQPDASTHFRMPQVQIGNEVTYGTLWATANQACADSGSITGRCE